MAEQISPDLFVQVLAVGPTECGFAWCDAAVGSFFIATYVCIGNQSACISKGSRLPIDVDYWTIGMQAK
jgi:hypothetical protein